LRLAKIGYYGGDPEKILKARCDYVIAALEYEKFLSDYEDIYHEINRGGKK